MSKQEINYNERRVTIKDIAESLGVSTATVSNVIHGKTKKISAKTVEKVQELLEVSGYIPNMAAVLLAQNSSKIICVMLSDDQKYNGQMLKDPFVSDILNSLSKCLNQKGYFMMVKEESRLDQIVQYASMWNMAGLILIGYCNQDYQSLRAKMRIPFLVIDGYVNKAEKYSNVGIDNEGGGYQAGNYLVHKGHRKIMFLSDNDTCGDHERYMGFKRALLDNQIIVMPEDFKLLPFDEKERFAYYKNLLKEIKKYTAAFCASDVYAIEWMNYLLDQGVKIPEDFSIIGFDDIQLDQYVRPKLTTIKQDMNKRAEKAIELLEALIAGDEAIANVVLPTSLVTRESVKDIGDK